MFFVVYFTKAQISDGVTFLQKMRKNKTTMLTNAHTHTDTHTHTHTHAHTHLFRRVPEFAALWEKH